MGSNPQIASDWFFGYMANWYFAQGVLSAAGVTQAYSGAGGGGSHGRRSGRRRVRRAGGGRRGGLTRLRVNGRSRGNSGDSAG